MIVGDKRIYDAYGKIIDYLVNTFGMSFDDEERVPNLVNTDNFNSDFCVMFDIPASNKAKPEVYFIAFYTDVLEGQTLQVLQGLKKFLGTYDFSIRGSENSDIVKFYPDTTNNLF